MVRLRTFVLFLVLLLLTTFACNKYMQAGDVSSLKQNLSNIHESAKARGEQMRLINEELERANK